ncbi:MAG: FAD-dependent oxidoreductase, partial [Thermoguttaceae bacterium]|nr:FAD-dependent oxidoreductase [Thermoguttaceae bacterium]
MKTIVIGAVAGGATAATRLRRLDEKADVILLERGDYVSFANCGLPYRLGGVTNRDALLVATPELLRRRFRVDVRTGSEAISIDRAAKTVRVRRRDGSEYAESYDALILATGASPTSPNVPGADDPRVSPLWTVPDSDEIARRLDAGARRALVVGSGFVALESAENLRLKGLEVVLAVRGDQLLKTIDREASRLIENELTALGVRVEFGASVAAFEPTADGDGISALLTDGRRLDADFVLTGIGVRPNSQLAQSCGLQTNDAGYIVVDEQMRTSDESIFAVGDVVQVVDLTTGRPTAVALAGPAQKQGRVAADAIVSRAEQLESANNRSNPLNLAAANKLAGISSAAVSESRYVGTLGASILKVGSLAVGSVGWTEKRLKAAALPFRKIYLNPSSNAGFYPGGTPIFVKLLFAPNDGKILGAQFVGRQGVDKRTDVVATAAQFGGTVRDLATLELAYAPPFNAAKDPVNEAGMIASNVLIGLTRPVYPDELPENALLLDVRTSEEFELATIPGAVNVPLDELRDRLGELDRSRPIVAFCQVGKRGYVAERILRQRGFDVFNLSGGFSTWRLFNPPTPGPSVPVSTPNVPQTPSAPTPPNAPTDSAATTSNADAEPLELDVRALACPGPIVRLRRTFDAASPGTVVRLRAAATFEIDLRSWARSTGVRIERFETQNGELTATLRKPGGSETSVAAQPLAPSNDADFAEQAKNFAAQTQNAKSAAIVLFSSDLDK